MADKSSKYKGKVLSLLTIEGDHNFDLISPIFETINGKKFITGIVPKEATTSGWTDGKINSVLWENVHHFYVFNSPKEFYLAVKKSESYEKKNKKKK